MYKHILIPTDGSRLSAKAVKTGISLAKSLGARVTAFLATPNYSFPVFGEGYQLTPKMSRTQFVQQSEAYARKVLAATQKLGAAQGVAVEPVHAASDAPFEAILRVASRRKCDLIVMASHGRRGISAVLLGSETQKVVTHSRVPVLVVR
jgi:nucleotide-binding universal stress UspA family protein